MVTQIFNRERTPPALTAGKGTMLNLLIVSGEAKTALPLQASLTQKGFA
jgi:hypothetical protein